jgi:hypothetical protein
VNKHLAATSNRGDGSAHLVLEGGCLCGDIRYKTTAAPVRITICHCTFCQKITGSAFLVEPIFKKQDVVFAGRSPRVYVHRSDTSQKRVRVNFCGKCGTPLYLDLERFPDIFGIFGGSFDAPKWLDLSQGNCRHIFTRSAQEGVVLPAGARIFREHALQLDGTPNEPIILTHALQVSYRKSGSS